MCMESNISTTTYYRLVAGYDHPLNVYVRILACFVVYCEPGCYGMLEREFMALLRAELCVGRGLELDGEAEKAWEKWLEISQSV